MNLALVLAPVFIQVALTFVLLIWSGVLRINAVRAKTVHPRDIALGEPNWPPRPTQVANAYRNQLELPILFYLAVVLAIIFGQATPAFVLLSWLFVAARIVHAAIHTTSNDVGQRFWAYTAGLAVVILMWVVLAMSLAFGGVE
jgi:hypothetical protein